MSLRKRVSAYLDVNGKSLQISSNMTKGLGVIRISNPATGERVSIYYEMPKASLISSLKQLVEWLER